MRSKWLSWTPPVKGSSQNIEKAATPPTPKTPRTSFWGF